MADKTEYSAEKSLTNSREARAALIAQAGGVDQALQTGGLNRRLDISVSEALVLGLLKQGVRKYISVFGHGSTEIAEVLRIYQQAGLVRVFNVRNEIEGSHAAAALRWISGEKAAVVASIGPGPLQAIAASLMPLSNGIGVWYLLGDETTEDEGPNFQQIPHPRQMQFAGLTSVMNQSYCLHTPLALSTALRRGSNVVDHPHRAGPFYLLLPMNVQPLMMHQFNLDELPVGAPPGLGTAADNVNYQQAVEEIRKAKKVVVRVGGGAGGAGSRILELLEKADGVAITAPVAGGVIPYHHPRNMTVAGSKGSISGNYAMENADLLIAIGTRFVCQSDCSRTGYLSAQHVININTDIDAVTHYGKTTSFLGDANLTLELLNRKLDQAGVNKGASESAWFIECTQKKKDWETYKKARYEQATLMDPVWKSRVFTQPAAIKIAADWARANQAVTIFDAGDVQAYGFQIVEDENVKQGITDGGASYMGFAASAILASGMADQSFYPLAFSGDGSFMMNPQVLIDAVQHRAKGCILLLDNRRMSAISALQVAQYGIDFATNDAVEVDYVALAGAVRGVQALHGGNDKNSLLAALDKALSYPGLTVIHVPVYYGPDPLGTLEAFGRWNVGIWSEKTQDLRHDLGL